MALAGAGRTKTVIDPQRMETMGGRGKLRFPRTSESFPPPPLAGEGDRGWGE